MGFILKGLGKKKAAKKGAQDIQAAIDAARPSFESAAAEFTPFIAPGTRAADIQANLLGAGDDPNAANAAFQNFLNSTGYQFRLGEGLRAISGNAAARGMLNSGSTAKALTRYGQGLASSEFSNYFGQLGDIAGRGFSAAASRAAAAQDLGNFLNQGGLAKAGVKQQGYGTLLGGGGTAISSILSGLRGK